MWNVYPRPQLKRESFLNLNGTWFVNGKASYVPKCESDEHIEYLRSFIFNKENDRAILHIGAADQKANVYLNNEFVGSHEGGYLPFDFDITDFIKEGENYIKIEVVDELDINYPYGKQKKKHKGMWYTPTSGIWKSVWIEQVPQVYIKDVKITTDLEGADVTLYINDCTSWPEVKEFTREMRFNETRPIYWDVDNPHLYYRTIEFDKDKVEIYYAIRKIEIDDDSDGIKRVFLNNKPIFLHGVLNQGYYKDGYLLPDDPSEYEKDILRMKELGFNMLRMHVKVETEEFYYACDRLGMLVMQDMVNSGKYHFFKDTVLGTLGFRFKDECNTYNQRQQIWLEHTMNTVKHLYNHPSIIIYTLFNEGWGQFDSDNIYTKVKELDPTRLIDSTSGWFSRNKSDFDSRHVYFFLRKIRPKNRPVLISECGGYTLNLNGAEKTYGYGKCHSKGELTYKILLMYKKMIWPDSSKGICGSVYTQFTDIEDEINGLYTFDRSTCKVTKNQVKDISYNLGEDLWIQ